MKTNQRRLYNHLLFAPISSEQRQLSSDVRNNKLGSYKNDEDDTKKLIRQFR